MVAACIFEQTLPLGIDEPPAVLDEFAIGVSLSARDGDAGAGKGWGWARAPWAGRAPVAVTRPRLPGRGPSGRLALPTPPGASTQRPYALGWKRSIIPPLHE